MADQNWDKRRESNSSNWSDASSPASINQRPKMPQDSYNDLGPHPGVYRRNPFQNPSPAGSLYDSQPSLQPPNAPFASGNGQASSSANSSKVDLSSAPNLSISYLPSKFSRPLSPGISYRKANKSRGDGLFRRGGGTAAFAANASRMPGAGDDDYDGVDPGRRTPGTLRWNRFKWILLFTNTVITTYSLAALVCVLLVWFNIWTKSEILLVANRPELHASTFAACACLLTALIGWAGILLNNRSFLAVYTLCLWISFAVLVIPGYITYKRRTFNLEGKINAEWSRSLGISDRLTIQNVLDCCGYYSPFVEATISAKCYSRSMLPGCKAPYLNFEREMLHTWYQVTFILVPFHIGCIVAALLCSNHVTYRFGKGMMPKAYRLNSEAMAVIMESFASNLAEQYAAPDSLTLDRDNYGYPPNGSRSRDSSNSGHDLSPSGAYGSYGSTSGLVRNDTDRDSPSSNEHYSNTDRNWNNDRAWDKRR